jgi:HD-like signal output (HDOD) protein
MNYPATPNTNAQRLLRGMKDLPSLPQVVTQVMALLNKPNSTGGQIAELVCYDPGLSSRILRMVNSSAYGIPRQVTSVQHAIAMLGFRAVHGLVLSASVCQILGRERAKSQYSLDVQAFWQHALMVSFLAKKIATLYRLPNEDEIFSAGMLHNIGVLAIYSQAPDLDKKLNVLLQTKGIERFDPATLVIEDYVLGFNHTYLGSELTQRWNLPELMRHVIEHYPSPTGEGNTTNSAVWCISLAHYLLAFYAKAHGDTDYIHASSLSTPLRQYFKLEEDVDLHALCEHIPSLKEESAEIMLMFAEG